MQGVDHIRLIEECVSQYRHNRAEGELEIRVGRYVNGRFVPGVERTDFEQLSVDLQNAPTLEDGDAWTEVMDYHYTTRDAKTRTRVTFDSQLMKVDTCHVNKVGVQENVFQHVGDENTAFRVAFSTETPVLDPPSVCIPTYVRIKQRRTFRDVRGGKVVWLYELSKTWSASSRSGVEHAQHMVPPVYEVECELVDEGGDYMKTHCDENIARSIFLKSQLLLGEDGEDVMFLPIVGETGARTKQTRSKLKRPRATH